MFGSGYLPDTNVLTAVIKRDHLIIKRLSQVAYYLSPIVIGELYHWAFGSPNKVALLNEVRQIIRIGHLAPFDAATSERYGRLNLDLLANGDQISPNDIWIASQAIQYGLILATRDTDFKRVPGLKVEFW